MLDMMMRSGGAAGPTTLLQDLFTGGAGELAAHTPDEDTAGNGWVEDVGDWELDGSGNAFQVDNTPSGQKLATVDVEAADVVITLNLRS